MVLIVWYWLDMTPKSENWESIMLEQVYYNTSHFRWTSKFSRESPFTALLGNTFGFTLGEKDLIPTTPKMFSTTVTWYKGCFLAPTTNSYTVVQN